VAKSAATYLNQKLAGAGRWFGYVLKLRWLLGLDQAISDHGFISSSGLFEPVYFSPILDRPVGQPNRTLNGYAFGSFKTEELGTAGLVGLKPALLKPRGVRVALII
jgi:hypothetical protein